MEEGSRRTVEILDAAIKVHPILGPPLLESIYEDISLWPLCPLWHRM